jgi:uncharacterized protein YrrD
MMQFRDNAGVFMANGDKVGHIAKVVMTPRTQEITHLVIRQGFLFTEDKVMPVNLVASADAESVVLRAGLGNEAIDTLPRYEEDYYVPADMADSPAYAMPDFPGVLFPYAPAGAFANYPPLWAEDDPAYFEGRGENIPEGTVALNAGAKVISADDKHVGHLERVVIDEGNKRASHFVIAQGVFFKDRKLVPTSWIEIVTNDEIRLIVSSKFLGSLPTYDSAFA